MKHLIILLLLVLAAGLQAQEIAINETSTTARSLAPAWTWERVEYDFGKIEQGIPVTAVFQLTNTGAQPLIIANAKGSCGCTVAAYTQEPIAPGETGFVKATYNASKAGAFSKTVTVTANTPDGNKLLKVLGEVIPKE